MSDEEILFGLGSKKDKRDRRDFRASGVVQTIDVPKQIFDLDDKFPSKNQFSRGSCTSQAQSHHKERQENKRISARFIMAKTKEKEGNANYGAYTRNTFSIVKEIGACSDDLYPEPDAYMSWEEYIDVKNIPEKCFKDAKNHKSQSYWRVERNLDEIKSILLQKGNSIVCSMEWFKEFNRPANGILPTEFRISAGGHAVELKGWNDFDEYLHFKNSWGESWGKEGDFFMPFSMIDKVVWDLWCSLDIPENLPIDERYGEKRTWAGYMREKSFAFNPWLFKKIGRLPNNREIIGLAYGFYSYESVFKGKIGDVWLKITKPEAIKRGIIDKNENLIK